MNIKGFIEGRKHSYEAKHFEKTKWGKRLTRYKDIHKGEKCFIIGNGPSLKAEDLQVLFDKNIITFATNRIYNIFEQTDWRPFYYVSEDANVLRGVQENVAVINSEAKFIPINLKWFEGIDIPNATYFYMDYGQDLKDSFGISLNIPHCIRCRSTVTTTCMQLAIYMGFSEIYLLGVDHSFAKMVDKNGRIIEDKSIKSHFVDDYNSDIPDLGYSIDATTEAYLDVEKLSKKTGEFRVYNATRGGKLEVYDRVAFDELFE